MRNTILLSIFISSILYVIDLQAQCVSGDCKNGRGIYIYPSGARYVGDFKDGEIHGMGTCYYTDGSKYQGQWLNRYPHGKGNKIYPNGSQWKGTWIKGKPVDGKGRPVDEEMVYKGAVVDDGTNIQTGCIQGNCKNGHGTFAYADGSKYEGAFANGNIHGQGTWHYPNGDKYVGSFNANFQEGEGVIVYADGSQTKGVWEEGEYIGNGWVDFGEEGCLKGDCVNGEGTYVYEEGLAKYSGYFLEGLPHGEGECLYNNGERYIGQWDNGSFNGEGVLYLADGSEVSGYWERGVFQSRRLYEEKVQMETANTGFQQKEEPQTTVAQVGEMKVWAVVIGISAYNHMPVLRYTDDDAYRIYAFLKSPEGGALKDSQIRILIDEEATKGNIKNAMTDIFSKAGPNDLVMLYFSGHGLKGSFLPIDFDGFNNKFFHEEITEILNQSNAKYKLCIADACHSGSLLTIKSGTAQQTLVKYYETLAQAQAGTALIMSSKAEETSLESSGLRQGVFSHFLIRGLKGEADFDGSKVVTLKELFRFIDENVRSYTGMRQSPVIQGDYDEQMTVSVVRD